MVLLHYELTSTMDSRSSSTNETRGRQRVRIPPIQIPNRPVKNYTAYTSLSIRNPPQRQEIMATSELLYDSETANELLLGMESEVAELYDNVSFEDVSKESECAYDNTSFKEDSCTYGELVELNGNLDLDLLSLEDEIEEVVDEANENSNDTWLLIGPPTPKTDPKESRGKQEKSDTDADSWSLEVCIDDQDLQEIKFLSCKCCFPEW